MVRRGGDADASGEGTSWLVLRHVPAEGLGLLANVLRDRGIHHRYLDLPRGEAPPRDLHNLGGLIVLGGPMAVYEAERHAFLTTEGCDDSVFGLLEPELTVFHMHGDTYELPADARHLARSALYEQQAFRWGDVVYGLQFHLEFTETMIQKLATEADSRAYITGASVDPQALVRGAAD